MSVAEIFETMEWGPAPESAAPAQAWLDAHGRRFGCFVGGRFEPPGDTFETRNPATGEPLAEVTRGSVDEAVAAARGAFGPWSALPGHARARALYALARGIQKRSRLFAVLETLDTGKPIREARDLDVPLAARHLAHHAGFAQLMASELPGRAPLGVCGQIVPWNFPLLMAAWKIAPALAMGNTVVLKPAEWTPLAALLLAEVAMEAGLPPGVLNVVTGDGRTGEALVASAVDKVAFTGSTEVGRRIREATAGTGKALTLELGGKSPYVVFEDADLDSAVEGLVDAIWLNGGQVCCAGSRLLVQEGIAEDVHARIRRRMDRLRIGDPLDKAIDVGAIADPRQLERIRAFLDDPGGEVHIADTPVPEGCFHPPTLVTGLDPTHRLMREEVFGPVLASTTFRTPAEAVQLANDTRYGLAASVWTENVNLALDMAPRIEAGVVWINAANLLDAAAPFGGRRESGFGREGGWEGLAAYTRPARETRPLERIAPMPPAGDAPKGLDRTAKLYVGGRQARPDGGASRAVWGPGGLVGHASVANRKDVRNAVEAARGSAWRRMTGHARAQVIYYAAEQLSARSGEFARRLEAMTGGDGAAEVDASVERLFHFAAWADKWDGGARGVPMQGLALALREPVGVIGALCPDEAPLLGLVTVMGAAMALGNASVLVASEPFPLAAWDLATVLEASDVPAGAVNLLTGPHGELAPVLAAHMGVDAVWSFSSTELSEEIERLAAEDLKRSWVNHGQARDWSETPDTEWLEAASEVKTVWVPYGEV
jgi:aldehyde dehydrogenase (NAD+)